MTSLESTARTILRRRPQRALLARSDLHAVLDAGMFCHIGYVAEGQPLVLPTIYWRDEDAVFWHGSRESRAIRAMAGAEVCFAVSHLDGLVLARSAFRHSVNYRSVMAFGTARAVDEEAAKLSAFQAMFERLYPGRWNRIRPPSRAELAAVDVLRLQLDEASVKQRTGPPLDFEADIDIPVWAGELPLRLQSMPAEPAAGLDAELSPPPAGPYSAA
jgi:nitroimidazol reductase NimA-like FMN-containing flavoprotein (pyridoxamine 5'-phosphate oxidase superfamily)